MNLKKLAKSLLFPHIIILIMLIPVAAVFLATSVIVFGSNSPVAVASYVLSAYTLTVWCFKIPYLHKYFKRFKLENKYVVRFRTDERLRVSVSLYGNLIFNLAFAVFQLALGVYHSSFWFYSLAGYYILLAVMRFFLLRHTRTYRSCEKMREELIKYRACGCILLVMNLALSLIVFFMIYWNRTFNHHEITTIAIAAFTFTALAISIVNIIKYTKYKSPVYSATQAISLAAACVSMLTLEATMLTTFGDETLDDLARNLMLGVSGGVIALVIIIMAIYMIVRSTKELRAIKNIGEVK